MACRKTVIFFSVHRICFGEFEGFGAYNQDGGFLGGAFSQLLSLFASLLALLGGLSIAFGYQAEIGAIFTLLFLLPVTFMVHRFWKYSDPMAVGNHRGHFWKNIGLIGGAMFILS